MAYVQFLIVCLIWSSSFILMKKAYVVFNPVAIGGLRAALGAATLVLLWHLVRRGAARRWPASRAQWVAMLVPGGLGFAYPYMMQPYLIGHHQDSAYFGMMVALVPLITIAVSVPMLGVWPRLRELTGVLVGLACLGVLAHEGGARGVPWHHVALAATVPLAYALSNTFIRQRLDALPPMALSGSALAIAATFMLPASLAVEPIKAAEPIDLLSAAAAVLVLGVIGSGLAMYLFYKLIQSHGPLFAGMVTYLVPLGALAWGWLDAERVTAGQLGAMAGILVSVALVQWPRRAAPAAAAPVTAGTAPVPVPGAPQR
ncbi:MAG: DMT family transporter [Phycisphaeraceae bacterium]